MDKFPISACSLEKFYYINGDQLERQYKDHLSGYRTWSEREHAHEWLVFPENVGPRMSIDETEATNGEVYTVLTNKDAKGKRGVLTAIIKGTKSEVVEEALERIPEEVRAKVEEITLDLSPSMRHIALWEFTGAKRVIDRFHVQKLAYDAIQEMRIAHRWEAIREDNARLKHNRETGENIQAEKFPNGDTRKQLLARSRYLLFKPVNRWTESQHERAKILFEQYPDISEAHDLTHQLRVIFNSCTSKGSAYLKLALWYNRVEKSGFESFGTIAETIREHYDEIANYFNTRATNASAEAFNHKIKTFRAQLRGVYDVNYFFFRLANIYA